MAAPHLRQPGLQGRGRRLATAPAALRPAAAEGEVELLLGSEWQTVSAGESVRVPRGERHTYRNHSGEVAAFRNVHDPHHDFEAYLRKLTTLSNELQVTSPNGPGAAARLAIVVGQYPDLLEPADVPMKVAMPILRTLGRVLRLNVPD